MAALRGSCNHVRVSRDNNLTDDRPRASGVRHGLGVDVLGHTDGSYALMRIAVYRSPRTSTGKPKMIRTGVRPTKRYCDSGGGTNGGTDKGRRSGGTNSKQTSGGTDSKADGWRHKHENRKKRAATSTRRCERRHRRVGRSVGCINRDCGGSIYETVPKTRNNKKAIM